MEIRRNRTIIIVDFNAVVISNLFVYAKQNADQVDLHSVRSMVLMSLKRYRKKFRRTHGELVICVDGKNVWRKKVFPYYKENRKKQKEKSTIDWSIIMSTINAIAIELYNHFPYKMIGVDGAEADDSIAVLSKMVSAHEPVIIISGDQDLIQLQRYNNVEQYDPIRDRFLTTDNPAKYLKEHILRGDDGDGIPNFMSDDDTFMDRNKRQKSIYKTKMEGWLEDPDFFETSEFKKNIARNKLLIDLENVPPELEARIKKQFSNRPKGLRKNLMKYFAKNNLSNMLSSIGEF